MLHEVVVCCMLRNGVSVLRNSDAGAAVLKKSTLTDADLFYINLNKIHTYTTNTIGTSLSALTNFPGMGMICYARLIG